MINPPLPKTDAEKQLELAFLKIIKVCVEQNMPLQQILNALEHVRHTMTEMKLEADRED